MSQMMLNNTFLYKFYDMLCTHNIRIYSQAVLVYVGSNPTKGYTILFF